MIGLLYKSNLVKIIFKIELLAFLIIDIMKYKVPAQNHSVQKGIFPYTPPLEMLSVIFLIVVKVHVFLLIFFW